MEVHLIRFHFEGREGKKRRMVLATTLTDHEKFDWLELAALYAQRWDIELRLRDVKIPLGMEHLRVKTPENARKTLMMALIAYNLIKSSCQEAAHFAGKDLKLMSFKGARYPRREHGTLFPEAKAWDKNPRGLGIDDKNDCRKSDRFQALPARKPRAQKKRPKSYCYLTKPRTEYKEMPHRGRRRALA